MSTTSTPSDNGQEGLVSKLQEALAKFRKDRDQLHRSRELALERCRLIKAEEEALSKTVQTMRDKHNHLLEQTAKIESQLGPLEAKVQKDTSEMHFQHAELLGARAKIQQLTNQLEETRKGQEKRLQQAQQLVCDLRSRQGSRDLSSFSGPTIPVEEQIAGLKKEMDNNIDFQDALSKAMDERIRQMESEIQFYRIQSNRMEEQMGGVGSNMMEHGDDGTAPPPHDMMKDQLEDRDPLNAARAHGNEAAGLDHHHHHHHHHGFSTATGVHA